VREIRTLGSAWGSEFKKPCSLGEGAGMKMSDNSEAPQKANASRLVSTIRDLTDSTNLIRIVQEVQPDEIYDLVAQSHRKQFGRRYTRAALRHWGYPAL
jgi:GDP-mannose 4,6 dehydratase